MVLNIPEAEAKKKKKKMGLPVVLSLDCIWDSLKYTDA